MLYDGDKFLGISDNFKYNNDGYEPQLGATLGTSKSDAENAWRALQASVADLRASAYIVVDEKNAISEAKKVTKVYTDARAYLSLTTTMLQNSLVGGGLSQGMVDGYIAGLNGYRAQVSGGEQGYSAWRNNAVNGLSGISTSLASLQKQLAIAEKNIQNGNFDSTIGYKRSVISMADRLRAAELSLKQAENAYTSAKNGKPISLSQASLSRNSASISLSQAQSEYAKLTLRAPVAGTITRISTDIGAMTNVGTPIYEIASNNAEVVLDLDSTTSRQVRNGDSVYIVGDTQTLTGTVVGISTVANASLQYTTRIAVPDTGKLL
jgi:multidrug resistance efflux pump